MKHPRRNTILAAAVLAIVGAVGATPAGAAVEPPAENPCFPGVPIPNTARDACMMPISTTAPAPPATVILPETR